MSVCSQGGSPQLLASGMAFIDDVSRFSLPLTPARACRDIYSPPEVAVEFLVTCNMRVQVCLGELIFVGLVCLATAVVIPECEWVEPSGPEFPPNSPNINSVSDSQLSLAFSVWAMNLPYPTHCIDTVSTLPLDAFIIRPFLSDHHAMRVSP